MQREAFNRAFDEAGLGWHWSEAEYREMLTQSGGRDRIADHARSKGVEADADEIHRRKTEIFQQMLRDTPPPLRQHTARLLKEAREKGFDIAVVSGTAKESLDALLDGHGGAENLGITLVTSAAQNLPPKPDPALYRYALDELRVNPSEALAIEDNVPGLQAAEAAGIRCLAYPNRNTKAHDFGRAQHLEQVADPLAA
jgi:beta-phosphoglucomutase-like phosphatase (HAD superfamily)